MICDTLVQNCTVYHPHICSARSAQDKTSMLCSYGVKWSGAVYRITEVTVITLPRFRNVIDCLIMDTSNMITCSKMNIRNVFLKMVQFGCIWPMQLPSLWSWPGVSSSNKWGVVLLWQLRHLIHASWNGSVLFTQNHLQTIGPHRLIFFSLICKAVSEIIWIKASTMFSLSGDTCNSTLQDVKWK